MSGSFLDKDVPPTLISFAIAPLLAEDVLSPEFKQADNNVYLFDGAKAEDKKSAWNKFYALHKEGKIKSAWAVENGLKEAIINMSFGNNVGFVSSNSDINWDILRPGAIIAEVEGEADAIKLGKTSSQPTVTIDKESETIADLLAINEAVLEKVYPNRTKDDDAQVPVIDDKGAKFAVPKLCISKPKVLIPVFPGTNCEYDSARAVQKAGLEPEIVVINNQTAQGVADSVSRFAKQARDSHVIFVPGGFSGGDEPDGSGKFITAFFRNPEVRDATMDLLKKRDGLMLGICNGFQALIKLGLVPYGEIIDTDESCPTLSYNVIGRHQSKIVHTRVASNRSPWLSKVKVGDIVNVPISHGEGRFLCDEQLLKKLAQNGQIATQYVDLAGKPTMDIDFNPNGSVWAIEGITSPDGRVLGKMGHSERIGDMLYKNVPGNYELYLFEAAKDYFSL